MFLVRQSKPKDVSTLAKMARMVYFINLPPDEQIIADKIAHSAKCFRKSASSTHESPAGNSGKGAKRSRSKPQATSTLPDNGIASSRKRSAGAVGLAEMDSDLFMFTIEDLTSGGGVVGTSQIKAHMGGPGNPNWSMKLSEKKFFSPELRQGTTHTVMKLYGDESGPSEIGGLILQPSHRGHPLRPGRLLSFVRFHFVGLHRALFADRILAEMIGVVSDDGESPFWDAFGRKFIPVKYAEADRFCQQNRRFISDLLPHDEIFVTLFPLEIQNLVGVVSRDAIPARRLIESLGFANRGFVDPFDGGPHLDAATDTISLVRGSRRLDVGRAITEDKCDGSAIVSTLGKDGEFRAIECPCSIDEDVVRIPSRSMDILHASSGDSVGCTPLPAAKAREQTASATDPAKASTRRTRPRKAKA